MKVLKRFISCLLIFIMVNGLIPGLWQVAFASVSNPRVFIKSYDPAAKKLTLSWSQADIQAATNSVIVSYHISGSAVIKTVPSTSTPVVKTASEVNISITEDFKSDYIFDIKVDIYDGPGGTGNLLGTGFIFFMSQMTFRSEIQEQVREPASSSGGFEIGTKPIIKISWTKPKVWNNVKSGGAGFDFADTLGVNGSLSSMKGQLDTVYNENLDIASLSYLVTIPSQSSVEINNVAGQYLADVTNDSSKTCKVGTSVGDSFLYLSGRKDITTTMPTYANVLNVNPAVNPLPASLIPNRDYVLLDSDILPGTVYNMSIQPVFKKTDASDIHIINIGDPSMQDDSKVYTQTALKLVPYAYTPIRFKLTKDSFNNIWVDIYRLNGGSDYLTSLTYAVQYSQSNASTNWTQPTTVDDTFFTGGIAPAVVPNMPFSVKYYYKIVVTSTDPTDRLESWYMPYTLSEDSSKPAAPGTVVAVAVDTTDVHYDDGTPLGKTFKTSDIMIKWKAPLNFSVDKNKLFFYFELSTAQNELLSPKTMLEAGGTDFGSFALKYRLVRYIRGINLIPDADGFLTYTLEGDKLFQGEDGLGNTDIIPVDTGYPTFLLPNKPYYLQMFSGMVQDPLNPNPSTFPNPSDKSLIVSFTTKNGSDLELPIPGKINATTDFTLESNKVKPYITLEFDKIKAPANLIYDIYMSNDAKTFIPIGSSAEGIHGGDLVFDGLDSFSTTIKVTINKFNKALANTFFTSSLKPNTTYYFTIKTRLGNPGDPTFRESVSTAIVPITTLRGAVGQPDDAAKRPLAPIDFAIAKDAAGNFLVSGSKATFTWTRQEASTKFEIIATSTFLAADAVLQDYNQDTTYQSFLGASAFPGGIKLDPDNPPLPPSKFTFDPTAKTCGYTIDKWLYPNRIYYFNIRAVTTRTNPSTGLVEEVRSVWVSIPITTTLIDSPTSLATINGSEFGFNWTDSTANTVPDDFKLYIQGSKDTAYKALNRSQATIVKNGTIFYGRILGLNPNSAYKVRVYKGTNTTNPIYENLNVQTRDAYHQLEVRWQGLPDYTYEIAIKTSDSTDYTTLIPSDFDLTSEKAIQNVGTSFSFFYARIKTVQITLPGGITQQQPLSSNTKYFIKVRAKKMDPLADPQYPVWTFSKYIGPVDTRTDFNQKDYDDVDQDLKQTATFIDKVEQLEASLFWRMDVKNKTKNEILLKDDRTVNAIQNSSSYGFSLDLSTMGTNIDTDIIYIPADVIKTLKAENKSIVIKTLGAEFTIRPNTLDVENMKEIKGVKSVTGVKDIFVKLTVTRIKNAKISLSNKINTVPLVNNLAVQAYGSTKVNSELATSFHDKVYDDKTGLVKEKKDFLKSSSSLIGTGTQEQQDAYVNELVSEVESELSDFIKTTFKESVGTTQATAVTIKNFSNPLMARLVYTEVKGMKLPYVLYDGVSTWKNIAINTVFNANTLTFNTTTTGKYAVIIIPVTANGVIPDSKVKAVVEKFMSKYDLSDIFTGMDVSFNPDLNVSCKEVLLIYEKVLNKTNTNKNLDIKQKVKSLQLDSIINSTAIMKDVTKEQTAGILLKIYAIKSNVNSDSLRPTNNIYIKDENEISAKNYKAVLIIVNMAVLDLDVNKNFFPKASMTRASVITAFEKLLEKTGDL